MADEDRCAVHARYLRMTRAYREGDMAAVKAELGWPQDFPNTAQPMALCCGDRPIIAAIMWSPLRFVRQLLELGADPNFAAPDGFPALFTLIDSGRGDIADLLRLLLRHGADVDQRGINDFTALHYAVCRRRVDVVRILLEHGADVTARTRIDDCTTALEDAEAAGFAEAVALISGAGWPGPGARDRCRR